MAGRVLGKRDTVGLAAPALLISGDNPFSTSTALWLARWDPESLPRIPFGVEKMTMRAPAGSRFQLFVDNRMISATSRASLNEWSPQGDAIEVYPGQSIVAYWSVATSPAPYLALYLRALR